MRLPYNTWELSTPTCTLTRQVNSSRELIRKKQTQAAAYAERLKVWLVFVLLAMLWVQETARKALAGIPDQVISGDWKESGWLPTVE
jgi:hypothetical protein